MESFKSIKLEWVLKVMQVQTEKLLAERITYFYLGFLFIGWLSAYLYLLKNCKGKFKKPSIKSNNNNLDAKSDNKQPQPQELEVELSDEEHDIECRNTAYDMISFSATLFMGVMGSLMWYGFYGDVDRSDRNIYARNETVTQYIVIPMACYQFWNFLTCLLIPGRL